MRLFGIANRRQQREADCLVAAIATVLDYLAVPVQYEQLRKLLGTTASGTPFSRVSRLLRWRLWVERGHGTLQIVQEYLEFGLPLLAAVRTDALPYWMDRTDVALEEKATDHVVVIVGLEDETVYLNDPDFAEAPQLVDRESFLLAWSGRDEEYAVIGLTEP